MVVKDLPVKVLEGLAEADVIPDLEDSEGWEGLEAIEVAAEDSEV
jgi:hypothetical protein